DHRQHTATLRRKALQEELPDDARILRRDAVGNLTLSSAFAAGEGNQSHVVAAAVIAAGVEAGIVVGVILSRIARPILRVGRIGGLLPAAVVIVVIVVDHR